MGRGEGGWSRRDIHEEGGKENVMGLIWRKENRREGARVRVEW